MDKKASREQRAEALKFVVHFVGDVHQPLHAVGEAKGGNGIHVRFLESERCGRYECNLHGVWDTSMIQHTGLNRQQYAARLERLVKTDRLAEQDGGTPGHWANESNRLAQASWVQDGADLDELYYQREIKVVDRQMALAGLRLAKLPPPEQRSARWTALNTWVAHRQPCAMQTRCPVQLFRMLRLETKFSSGKKVFITLAEKFGYIAKESLLL